MQNISMGINDELDREFMMLTQGIKMKLKIS